MEAEKNEVRRYLLGQLAEADQERLELRLLTDPTFLEEFDTVVDEIADQYVADDLKADERQQVERYFLTARERRNKVKFASALRNYASASRDNKDESPAPVVSNQKVSLRERLIAFWSNQGLAFRVATAMATILVVAGVTFLAYSGLSRPTRHLALELAITYGDRAEGPPTPRVKISQDIDELRIRLLLPEGLPESKDYRVESFDENNVKRELEIDEQDEQTVTVVAPVSDLTTGRYGLHLTLIKPDGTEQRIPGTYRFEIE